MRNGESEVRTAEEDDGLMFLPGKNVRHFRFGVQSVNSVEEMIGARA